MLEYRISPQPMSKAPVVVDFRVWNPFALVGVVVHGERSDRDTIGTCKSFGIIQALLPHEVLGGRLPRQRGSRERIRRRTHVPSSFTESTMACTFSSLASFGMVHPAAMM